MKNHSKEAKPQKLLSGYTLVEAVVVMAIAAILTLLSASALLAARDQHILDDMTQGVVTAIREAQNRAISISEGEQAWGVSFDLNPSEILLLEGPALSGGDQDLIVRTPEDASVFERKPLMAGASITFGNDARSIFFAAPFGTSYLTRIWEDCRRFEDWAFTKKSTREIQPTENCIVDEDEMEIEINYKGRSSTIYVNRNGDVSAN